MNTQNNRKLMNNHYNAIGVRKGNNQLTDNSVN
jgi:hypothetical protein